MRPKPFPFHRQRDARDCGPACLQMIASFYGRHFELADLQKRAFLTRQGVSLLGLSECAEDIGMRALAAELTFEELGGKETPLPFIAFWDQKHFVVVYRITAKKVYVADPAHGRITYPKDEFLKKWLNKNGEGIGLFLDPMPAFFEHETKRENSGGFRFLTRYLLLYKNLLVQLFIGVFFAGMIGLAFPFLTQSLVDIGIGNRDISFVYAILLAQLLLFTGKTLTEFLRGWLLLHLGTRVNLSILSDFFIKIMKLPLSFFDSRHIGDLIHRINDHKRVEEFLTSHTLNVLFSFMNLGIFGLVLAIYSMKIFVVFCLGSLAATLWVLLFLKKRKELDYKNFSQLADNQTNQIQILRGMSEIKINRCEQSKRWEWEGIQAKLFRLSLEGLAINQYQQAGNLFLNELKNIIISFIAAYEVINGQMTLGMMMAVTYIAGQLNAPIEQLIHFIQAGQDAKLSLDRLGEIHAREEENTNPDNYLTVLPEQGDLTIQNLDFHYQGPSSEKVLDQINLTIPAGKTTAIVGSSGSGKTTLFKLLLKFYPPTLGAIEYASTSLDQIHPDAWRQRFGVVMQDGFIFDDTIAGNIALGDESVDSERLIKAAQTANIAPFIESLPLGYGTMLGEKGQGVSEGQKQRILIARAIYKEPQILLFDEATSALDARNEKEIMTKLKPFFESRTVVVIAHRLSTVRNADAILVLDEGRIIETGNHETLTKKRGAYYHLVKNQLELGQ